jgi:hypothetical protein
MAWEPATRAVQPREASEKTMSRKTILMIVAAAMFAAGLRTAKGQAYTCKNLFQLTVPSGYYIGRVSGISADGSQVVGIEGQNQSGFSFAIVWNNPTSLGTNLNPSNSNSSGALATNGQLQVGAANQPGPNEQHPVVWSSTANSAVFLSPANYIGEANGVAGNQIVGVASLSAGAGDHALLWTGNTYAVTDLQPSSAVYYGSDAVATDGVRQVGYGETTTNGSATAHAMLWDDTASSAIDLNPSTTTFSQALGINGAQQVGIGSFGNNHAMLWTGTANSAVDLNPSNYAASEALSTNGIDQIGYAYQGSGTTDHAMMWTGTAASALDLSSLVPGNVGNSQALAIDANGDVFGYAVENNNYYAVEWSPVPEPTTGSLLLIAGMGMFMRRRRKQLA